MRKSIFIIFVITYILSACDSGSIHGKLANIDSLLKRGQVDSASMDLDIILKSQLDNNEDRAYYNLLKTETDYRQYIPSKSDNLIDYSINYYSEKNDDVKLAAAYFYKGAINDDKGKTGKAFNYIKKAEYIARNTQDIELEHKIYEMLSYLNQSNGEYELAFKYTIKNLHISQKARNYKWIVYAYSYLQMNYYYLNKKDSSDYYLKKSIPYLKYISGDDRAYFYSNIGAFYSNINKEEAKKYYEMALSIKPISATYSTLSMIYFAEGNYEKAEHLITKALDMPDDIYKVDILKSAANIYAQFGYYKKSYELMLKSKELDEKINIKRRKENISNMQMKYDYEMKAMEYRNHIYMAIYITIIVSLLTVLAFIIHRYRKNKMSRTALQSQLLINIYNDRIKKLKEDNTNSTQKVIELENKVLKLRNKQTSAVNEGKTLYDKLMAGETAICWTKNDFVHFIEYYKIIDLPFVVHLETNFDDLSPRYKFFEILNNMGKTEEDVERILGISHSTIRSNRTIIKMKMLKS